MPADDALATERDDTGNAALGIDALRKGVRLPLGPTPSAGKHQRLVLVDDQHVQAIEQFGSRRAGRRQVQDDAPARLPRQPGRRDALRLRNLALQQQDVTLAKRQVAQASGPGLAFAPAATTI